MYFDSGGVDRASRLHGFYRLPGNARPYLLPRSWIDDPSQAVGAVAWASDSVGGDGNGHNPARQASMEIHASHAGPSRLDLRLLKEALTRNPFA